MDKELIRLRAALRELADHCAGIETNAKWFFRNNANQESFLVLMHAGTAGKRIAEAALGGR